MMAGITQVALNYSGGIAILKMMVLQAEAATYATSGLDKAAVEASRMRFLVVCQRSRILISTVFYAA